MWVRGLKHILDLGINKLILSHPMWVRGLKQGRVRHHRRGGYVAPYVGAWIETLDY